MEFVWARIIVEIRNMATHVNKKKKKETIYILIINFYKVTRKCEKCHSSCRSCSGPQPSDCLICEQGMFATTDRMCVSDKECPAGTYPELSKNLFNLETQKKINFYILII
jgi:hypothetical protein